MIQNKINVTNCENVKKKSDFFPLKILKFKVSSSRQSLEKVEPGFNRIKFLLI